MRTRPPILAHSASSSSASPRAGTAAPVNASDGAHAGAGPSTALRVGQRRSAQQAGLDGPPLRGAPALRQPAQAQLRGADFVAAPGRPAVLSPQEMAGLQALVGTPAGHAHHGQVRSNLPSTQELSELAGLLDSPTPSDGVPMSPAPHGHARPDISADNAASASLPLGPLGSDSILPPLEQLMNPAQQGPAHDDMAAHSELSSTASSAPGLAAASPPRGQGASRAELGLLERSTSEALIGPMREQIATRKSPSHKKSQGRALDNVRESFREALQDPQRRQALQRQGISLNSHSLDAQGQPISRQSQLTPLLEQAERHALVRLQGLGNADMAPLDRAQFIATTIREQLGQEKATGSKQRNLAQPAGSATIDKAEAKQEGGQLSRLSAAYAGKALGLDPAATALLRQRVSASGTHSRDFQLKLRDLSERQGPLAVALVNQLYDSVWISEQAAVKTPQGEPKPKNGAPTSHRQALVEALLQADAGVMQKLIDAAHRPDPNALAGVCRSIEAKVAHRPNPSLLLLALERLRGENPSTAAYAGAPPADQALRWLQSKAPSAAGE
jgi:hypothetical protein